MSHANRLSRKLHGIREKVPPPLQGWLINQLFGRFVPFLNTAGLMFEEVSSTKLSVSIRNRRKVQNHIKGIHATAMALLGETATGFIVVLNLPDDKLPLLKSMNIRYTKRSHGDMRATAQLSDEDILSIKTQDKGELLVPVKVVDETGEEPIQCEFVWAWVPKKK